MQYQSYTQDYSVSFHKIPSFRPLNAAAAVVGPSSLVRSSTSHTTGKFYFEATILVATSVSTVGIGVDDGTESVNDAGGKAGGVMWVSSGSVNYNGASGAFTV